MPYRPGQKDLYPPNWQEISHYIRFVRAGGQCEWIDQNGQRCTRRHGEPIPGNARGSKTILTTAHLDHNPANCAYDNLKAYCQMHHLRYDAPMHARNAALTRAGQRQEQERQLYGGATLF